MVTEIKAGSVKVGAEYTLMAQLGKLNNGDKVKVDDVEAYGNDVKITLVNQDGVSDFFILDRNDDFELN
jgi:methenyltetrahydromethanopterin cyclohydrolase